MKIAELFSHWEEARGYLLQALDKFTDDELRFAPYPGAWSVGEVACHIAQVEEGWIHGDIRHAWQQEPDYRWQDYPSVAAIKALLAQVHERTLEYLRTEPVESLDRTIVLSEGETTVRWILWHVIEHEIHHRGEIFLMLGLLGKQGPDI
jgi:uncharacterized damage-inducible protein DinB